MIYAQRTQNRTSETPTIGRSDAAKIRKDAEIAIKNDEKLLKQGENSENAIKKNRKKFFKTSDGEAYGFTLNGKIAKENGGDMTAKVLAEAAIRKVKGVLDKFWRGVASMMGWKYISIRSKKKAVKIGAIKVDGKVYRVKTTMLEYKQADTASREYAYDVTKIEVLDDTTPNTSVDLDRATKGPLPFAKIIKKL